MRTDVRLQNRPLLTRFRFFSADAIQKANSGHPGVTDGYGSDSYTIWNASPAASIQPTRVGKTATALVLSGGHGFDDAVQPAASCRIRSIP